MSETTLTGLFFVNDCGEFFRTGVIVRQAHPDAYLVRFDVLDGSTDMPNDGMSLLTVSQDLSGADEDFPAFRFFETRAELQTYVDWMKAPRKSAHVVSLVKKGKAH